MADFSEAVERAQIATLLNSINDNLMAIHTRMADGHRITVESTEGSDNPEADLHTAVSATLELVDACREIASYLQQIAAILNEKL